MSDLTFRELARRRGVWPMARNLKKQGASLNSAMRMLLGVNPIPVLTDAVILHDVTTMADARAVVIATLATREPARLLTR